MAALDELNVKYGPAPLWIWGLVTAIGGAWYLIRRKNKSTANQQSTAASADQTNTNLGSASQLANLFEVAGLMPYQGGDTFVNVTENEPGGSSASGGSGGSGGGLHGGNPPQGGGSPAHLPVPAQGGTIPPKQTTGSYVVKTGDTLWDLTPKLGFGSSPNYMKLYKYDGNQATIDNTARSHGATSNFPSHIYPGEVLHYPKVG